MSNVKQVINIDEQRYCDSNYKILTFFKLLYVQRNDEASL